MLDHVAILAKDFDKSVDFYSKVLGFSIIRKMEFTEEGHPHKNFRAVFMRIGQSRSGIEILGLMKGAAKQLPPVKRTDIGFQHISLYVANMKETYEDLKRKGVKFRNEPISTPRGAKIAYMEDPDGVEIELIERTPGTVVDFYR